MYLRACVSVFMCVCVCVSLVTIYQGHKILSVLFHVSCKLYYLLIQIRYDHQQETAAP